MFSQQIISQIIIKNPFYNISMQYELSAVQWHPLSSTSPHPRHVEITSLYDSQVCANRDTELLNTIH